MEQKKLSKYKTVRDYVLKSKFGESSSSLSTVWKAKHLSSGDVVAVKQVYVEKVNKLLKSCLDCELNFVSSVNHPNIIRLFDAFQLHGRVPEQTARKFLQQLGTLLALLSIGAGLEILNSHHIIHRDLKPENILPFGLDDDVMLKIADFGLSCFKCKHYAEVSFLKSLELKIDCLLRILSSTLHPGNYAEKVCGSPLYMAPEVLQFQRYDEKLIVPALHPDCVDMCLKLLSANPVIPHSLLNSLQWIVCPSTNSITIDS
ncbi:serine/threonine-protein kinase ATG1t [Citrus sinensis]|uniref:Serine/threonine-protein kinase ATG1t n=1 Tax=Citrus sinensis TaxID=2711 RepID=A0ACB8JJQ0_CITSI|nr:serine/threonine-protein kinase ATG1t [Citrus sinensis]